MPANTRFAVRFQAECAGTAARSRRRIFRLKRTIAGIGCCQDVAEEWEMPRLPVTHEKRRLSNILATWQHGVRNWTSPDLAFSPVETQHYRRGSERLVPRRSSWRRMNG